MKYLLASFVTLLLAAAIALHWQRRQVDRLGTLLTNTQSELFAAEFEASVARVHVEVVTRFVDRIRVIHETTTALQSQVTHYVPPHIDRAFPLTIGFVRLHDAAAEGVLPGPAGSADEEPSDIAPSQAIRAVADNYGTCHEIREQLIHLQQWARSVNDLQTPTRERR